KILADLNRRLKLAREHRIAGVIVMADGLLEPINAFPIESVAALARLRQSERLVVVDHHGYFRARPFLDGVQGGEIVLQRRVAEPELDRTEAAGEQLLRLLSEFFRRHQAEAAGIVRGNRLWPRAEKRRERHP